MKINSVLVKILLIFLKLAEKQGDDWEYLKKTVSQEGKYISDDFIRYHQITDQLVEDEDAIVNTHMNIIKVREIIYKLLIF